LVIVAFAVIYFNLSKIAPESFTAELIIIDCIYYSAVVGTTAGFRDIAPRKTLAKDVTISGIIFGLFFLLFF
jgi:hypothetical protein